MHIVGGGSWVAGSVLASRCTRNTSVKPCLLWIVLLSKEGKFENICSRTGRPKQDARKTCSVALMCAVFPPVRLKSRKQSTSKENVRKSRQFYSFGRKMVVAKKNMALLRPRCESSKKQGPTEALPSLDRLVQLCFFILRRLSI